MGTKERGQAGSLGAERHKRGRDSFREEDKFALIKTPDPFSIDRNTLASSFVPGGAPGLRGPLGWPEWLRSSCPHASRSRRYEKAGCKTWIFGPYGASIVSRIGQSFLALTRGS